MKAVLRIAGIFLGLLGANCRGPLPSHQPRPASVAAYESRLRDAEDARSWPDDILDAALAHPEPAVRARALLGIARARDPRLLPRIPPLLADRSAPVLQAALFALETTLDASGAPPVPPPPIAAGIRPLLEHPSFDVRTWAARAAGSVRDPSLLPPLRLLLQDHFADVRSAAVVALGRLRDRASLGAMDALTLDLDSGLRWRIAWAAGVIGGPEARPTLLRLARDAQPDVRLAAISGLTGYPDSDSLEALLTASGDPDPRLRAAAAVGLAGRPGAAVEQAFHRLLRDPLSSLRRPAVAEILARGGRPIGTILRSLIRDPRPEVAAPALAALARQSGPEFRSEIGTFLASSAPAVRAAAAPALAAAGDPASLEALRRLARDPDPAPRAAAFAAAPGIGGDLVQELLLKALESRDPGDRGVAARIAASRPAPWLIEPLKGCARLSTDRGDGRVRAAVLEALAACGAVDAVATGLTDPLAAVRLRAWELLTAAGRTPEFPSLEAPWSERLPDFERAFDASLLASRPEVTLVTTKGKIRIRLFPAEAPVRVWRFRHLVRSGSYDGTTFHNVETGSHATAGDPRGDGWGDGGFVLRDEINPRPVLRGAVVSLPWGRDAGGSPFTIVTRHRPEWDGVATVFGEVVEGMATIDGLEPGDVVTNFSEAR